jgi:hypothetical protein
MNSIFAIMVYKIGLEGSDTIMSVHGGSIREAREDMDGRRSRGK